MPTTVSRTITTTGTHDRLVVALAGKAPAALIDAEEDQQRQAADDHPPDGGFAQFHVLLRWPAVEAQLEGEVVRERDQRPVHCELRQRATVEGEGRRTDPSAHCQIVRAYSDCSASVRLARSPSACEGGEQKVDEQLRVATHARLADRAIPLREIHLLRVLQAPQPAFGDQPLVDCA